MVLLVFTQDGSMGSLYATQATALLVRAFSPAISCRVIYQSPQLLQIDRTVSTLKKNNVEEDR